MILAMETKVAATFYNAKEGLPLCVALEEMGHPQGAVPIRTDNSTAKGIVN